MSACCSVFSLDCGLSSSSSSEDTSFSFGASTSLECSLSELFRSRETAPTSPESWVVDEPIAEVIIELIIEGIVGGREPSCSDLDEMEDASCCSGFIETA